jgi:hypothetical protein
VDNLAGSLFICAFETLLNRRQPRRGVRFAFERVRVILCRWVRRLVEDEKAARHKMLGVIDESVGDYFKSEKSYVAIDSCNAPQTLLRLREDFG